jgi:beta-barrel assembly-enhancing protease
MKKKPLYLLLLTMGIVAISMNACDKNNDLVIFSVQNDIDLGAQIHDEILSKPDEFPILSEEAYPEAYAYINEMTDKILQSGKVTYQDEFVWKVHIIDKDILNAFVTPGGYIYVYTGLIHYLDKEDDLAGVMGHEVAHADRRHTSKRLQKYYGVQMLLGILLGQNPGKITEIAVAIATNAAFLSFSRSDETESDMYSVEYLANTEYACNGAGEFFRKLVEEGHGKGVPEFLSTHPSPKNRVADINAKADEIACSTEPRTPSTYQDFKNSLPPVN